MESATTPATKLRAVITRLVLCGASEYEDEVFAEEGVDTFEQALDMCRRAGGLGGITDPGVEFEEIKPEAGTASFYITKRMRYADTLFSLTVTEA